MSTSIIIPETGPPIRITSRPGAVTIDLVAPQSDVNTDPEQYNIDLTFDEKGFIDCLSRIQKAATDAWPNIQPLASKAFEQHYYEGFDSQHQDYGYLSLGDRALRFGQPIDDKARLYAFEERKMQSFLFDSEQK